MRTPYGFTQCEVSAISINQEQAAVVCLIYELYLQGKSLGGIADALKERGIPSPTGKPVWVRAAVDNVLSNSRYVPHSFRRISSAKHNLRGTAEQTWSQTTEQERPPSTTRKTY